MTHQAALFHDSIYDALKADVSAAGGIKEVARRLWPAHADAAAKLRACLADGHAQKLDIEEILAIKGFAKAVGSFATVTHESQVLAFKVEWIAPEDEKAELQRQFIENVRVQQDLVRR